MKEITLRACAKINLTLDVLQKRADGYHDIRSVMQTIDLCDEIGVTVDAGQWSCSCDGANIPGGEENLAMRAARAFVRAADVAPNGIAISIKKRIPSQAGLGGGSADAAAVLRALNTLCGEPFTTERLMEIGASVGSDVPFCVLGGAALAEGRGEVLTPIRGMPDCAYVLLKPAFSASTPALYAALDRQSAIDHPDTDGMIEMLSRGDLQGAAGKLGNVFQPVLNADHPVDALCEKLLRVGALGALMTGSGSVVFGIFPNLSAAESAAQQLRGGDFEVYTAQNG
ncbi:MAG: 4-(cytidine 5'-diphospho)-2-C-methyl-D-erythritol kinase [Oscillospiraceae bacterium]|nr:4-(cytidine 5'-diphospho)-2-C-methyl-D-erythritol kinase [Oscillospiraceae bacterium]MBR3850193.1 4-(cytidine 5'-diphospho)-2-C-methyl-D-erythritol kinase [Oscillospiraceae bacterium]